jgi:hypothetical protein
MPPPAQDHLLHGRKESNGGGAHQDRSHQTPFLPGTLVGLLTPRLSRLSPSHPASPSPRHNDQGMGTTGNGWMAAGLRRLDTAAGPSRNRTGVPCLPTGRSGDRRATRIQWLSLRNVRALSICAENGHTNRQVSPTAVGPVKLCRSGKKSASKWSGCRASGRTDYARVTGCISYPAVNVSRLLKNTWVMLKPVSICVR